MTIIKAESACYTNACTHARFKDVSSKGHFSFSFGLSHLITVADDSIGTPRRLAN